MNVTLATLFALSGQGTANSTNRTDDSDCYPRSSIPEQAVLVTFYLLIIVVGAGGNGIVVWIILGHKRMRTVTHYFLVNLAITDTINAIFIVPFSLVTSLLGSEWVFGNFYCVMYRFISTCTVMASITTLVAISMDRYFAIVFPLREKLTKLKARLVIFLIWLISALFALPFIIYSKDVQTGCINALGQTPSYCMVIWPDSGFNYPSLYEKWYMVLWFVFSYVIPLAMMGVAYSIVGLTLWSSRAPGALGVQAKQQEQQLKSKRRVVKMMIIVVLLFACNFLPSHIYFLTAHIHLSESYTRYLYLAVYWFAMSNSMWNPFIYCWLNDRFRNGFRRAFRCCPFVQWNPGDTLDSRPNASVNSAIYSTTMRSSAVYDKNLNGAMSTTDLDASIIVEEDHM